MLSSFFLFVLSIMNKILNNISASLNTNAELTCGTTYKRGMEDEREAQELRNIHQEV